jgi:hypothetical protein
MELKRNFRPRHHVYNWAGYDDKNAESISTKILIVRFLCNRPKLKELTQLLSNGMDRLNLESLFYEVKVLVPSLKYLGGQSTKSGKAQFRPYLLKSHHVCT